MYRIQYLADIHAIETIIVGFLHETDVRAFASDLAALIAKHSKVSPPTSLYNFTDSTIQSQAVVGLFQEMARRADPRRRVALYTDGHLARMQASRIADAASANMRLFETRGDAITWLSDPLAAQAA